MSRDIILLAIRGSLSPRTIEEARVIHNETAGNPQGVAAARSLGDLSHNVFVPLEDTAGKATELLILDLWNNPEGLQTFFSDPQVQAGGSRIFTSRDPVVWTPAADCISFMLPTPAARTERYVGLLRATVKSRQVAAEGFNVLASRVNETRKLGQISHGVFYRMMPPGHPESLELFAIDTWMEPAGMMATYQSAEHMKPLEGIFAGPPVTSVWRQAPGAWVEW
jgi:hypothetical protein